jgi:hypothetical protein
METSRPIFLLEAERRAREGKKRVKGIPFFVLLSERQLLEVSSYRSLVNYDLFFVK